MKIRPSILLLTVFVAILIGLMFWYTETKPPETPLAGPIETNATPLGTSASHQAVPASVLRTSAPSATVAAALSNAVNQLPGGKAQQSQEILSTYNDVPIDFYGKLVDQFGSPVAGAQIKGSIRVINGVRQGTDWLTTTSGADGRLEFHGKGQDIGMAPSKPGYAYVSMNGTGNYSLLSSEEERAHPDPNNPVILKMWKLQGGERLMHFQTQASVPLDGTSRAFDLKTGAQAELGGDVIVSVKCPTQPDVRQQYDWEVTIQGVGGGLLVSTEGFEQMFQAPDSGYEPMFVVGYKKGAKPWSTTFNGVFYFTSRNGGFYGKLGIEVLSDVVKNGTVPIILNSYLNTAGSRNLEIDPNLVAEAHP